MRRTPIALLTTAACAILALPAISSATPEIGQKDNGFSITDETYLRTYEKCWKAFDSQCGRNIVDDQLASGKAPSDAQIKESTATMTRWLNPPEPAPVAVDSPASIAPAPVTSTVAPSSASTGTSWDSVAACESSGDWGANTGNGYYGGLQFDSGTWDAYGDPAYGEASDAPASAQIAAAESMPYDGWPNC